MKCPGCGRDLTEDVKRFARRCYREGFSVGKERFSKALIKLQQAQNSFERAQVHTVEILQIFDKTWPEDIGKSVTLTEHDFNILIRILYHHKEHNEIQRLKKLKSVQLCEPFDLDDKIIKAIKLRMKRDEKTQKTA